MKATELRIGNLVLVKGKFIGEISELREVTISINGNSGVFTYEDIEPIPLTEEWLVKLGFEKRFDTEGCNLWDYESEMQKSWANRGQGFFCLANFIGDHGFWLDLQSRRTIRCVHELQNLFNSITGEELTY